jgi:hypothetical protein
MNPDQLTAAGFDPCLIVPGLHWPGDEFAPLYVRYLPTGPGLYAHCPLERPEEVVAFVGDWSRPLRYWQGPAQSLEQLLGQLGLDAAVLSRAA